MGDFGQAGVGDPVLPCSLPPKPAKPLYWIEIELVGEDDSPISWEEYVVTLPDSTKVRGFLDADGFARIDNIEQQADCRISFPKLDQEAWTFVKSIEAKGE